MTAFFLSGLVVGILVGVVGTVAVAFLWTWDPGEIEAPEAERRTAVHEIGHALVMHCSPFHRLLQVVLVREEGDSPDALRNVEGWTIGRIPDSHDPDFLWHDLAYCLGGLAAEAVVFRNFRSGPARGDLTKALAITHGLVGTEPPWAHLALARRGMDFRSMFRVRIDDESEQVMQEAYSYARLLVLMNEEATGLAVRVLLSRGKLETLGLKRVFFRVRGLV